MRDILIKLIKNAEEVFPKDKPVLDIEEFVADYLLAKGVIVLPCKVGDTVFIIDNRDMLDIDPSVCSVVDDEIFEMDYGRTQSGELKWLFLLVESGEYFYDDEVGKTVFLTREEAEKALAQKKGGAE